MTGRARCRTMSRARCSHPGEPPAKDGPRYRQSQDDSRGRAAVLPAVLADDEQRSQGKCAQQGDGDYHVGENDVGRYWSIAPHQGVKKLAQGGTSPA